MSKYEVKGVKYHKGHEGEPLAQCSLYRDGVKVAEYSDGDWGSEARFWWSDDKVPKVSVQTTNYDGKPCVIFCTPEEAVLREHIKGMKWKSDTHEFEMSIDIFVSDIIQVWDNENRFKRLCKNKTLFRVKGDPADEWRTIKAVYSVQVKDFIVKKYGDKVEEILNERFAKLAA